MYEITEHLQGDCSWQWPEEGRLQRGFQNRTREGDGTHPGEDSSLDLDFFSFLGLLGPT